MLVELHRQQQHGLLSVKDTGSKARRQAGPAVLETAIETASSPAMALYAGSLEQQKLSAKGSALAKGHVNRTNVTNGKRANKRMLNFQYIAWVGYRTSHGCQRQRLQRRFFFSGRSQMHTNVDVRAAFLGQGLENRKKLVGNNMNKVTEIYIKKVVSNLQEKISTKQHVFSTDTFYLLIKSNIAGKKSLRNNLFSLRNIFTETFSVYRELLLETLFKHVNKYFNISRAFCARLCVHMCTMEINACMP